MIRRNGLLRTSSGNPLAHDREADIAPRMQVPIRHPGADRLLRRGSRLGASMTSFSTPATCKGTAAVPLPMTTPRRRPGCFAAVNNKTDVPISGPTACGRSSPKASINCTMNSPIADGVSNSFLRSEWPNRQVDRNKMRMLRQAQPHLLECVEAFRPRAQQNRRYFARRAFRITNRQAVDRSSLGLNR